MHEPSTSQTQMLERQLSVEMSSFKMLADKDQDIKERYKEIKARNERFKAQTYAQYLKLTPTNQTRLMSAFEIKEGKLQMTFMKPTTQQPKTTSDFKRVDFEVLTRDIHPIDQIELHKQAGEMIYSTLTSKSITSHQLQNSLNNISTQFQLEKASSQAKDTRIKSLKDLVIELGHDPKDIKAT